MLVTRIAWSHIQEGNTSVWAHTSIYMYTYLHTYIYPPPKVQTHAPSTDTDTHTRVCVCTFVQIQWGYTAVEFAKDTHTIEVLKAAGATVPEILDQATGVEAKRAWKCWWSSASSSRKVAASLHLCARRVCVFLMCIYTCARCLDLWRGDSSCGGVAGEGRSPDQVRQ